MGLRTAVVGATGAVGRELLGILEDRQFPVSELIPFASPRSAGKGIQFGGKTYLCQALKKGCFAGVDIAFFDASDAISKEWVMEAASAGAWVIDNSAVYRMEMDIPLLVPEINGALLEKRLSGDLSKLSPRERIFSGPNCSTVQLVMALKPLRDRWGLKRVVVSTYQSASGAGSAAMEELSAQAIGLFNQKHVAPKAFKHQLAFNCIPQIGGFVSGGTYDAYTSEEHKIIEESRKILDEPDLRISATAVRVPTFSCHGESVNVELDRPLTVEDAREALRRQPGVIVQDNPAEFIYPMGMAGTDSKVESGTGLDAVYVGRIRRDFSVENGINFWIVSDNLRKGAALNAVQAGEALLSLVRKSR
ncbi:MAG: aspartate-semialdehyde dehydrogenase [Oligoflexia bacterium]|nr:aspartate-semialdehyde dehydrogenase [Oligoflexia bacterium]